ncbi:hypothetical protein ADUPG1_001066, partial [Aduncisulcus paluster]
GDEYSCPIPKDGPNIKSPEYFAIKAVDTSRARNETKEEDGEEYDQSSEAQKMMLGERNVGHFTHISIPFSPASPLKGAYICLEGKGEITAKKYEFPEKYVCIWYYLPIDLSDIILCEITGKGRYKQYFSISSLVFISRGETPEELVAIKTKKKLWSEAPVVKPEFILGTRYV